MLEAEIALTRGGFSLNVRFACAASGVTALFGPSGAGKSTVLAAIAGLLRPASGHLRLGGETLFDAGRGIDLKPERRRIGFVFQDLRLFPHLDVEDNLRYGLRRALDAPVFAEFGDIVALLGLRSLLDRRPATLSGGERQRVAIGRALLSQPRLLLMDEPLAALDAPRKREILDHVALMKERLALPILYVSHSGEEVIRLADTVIMLESGRIQVQGPLVEIFSSPDIASRIVGEGWGSLIEGKIAGHDLTAGLTEIAFPGGRLKLALAQGRLGDKLRLRIPARDVILGLAPVQGLSVQNTLAAEIVEIREAGEQADVILGLGPSRIVSRITRAALMRLKLQQGQKIFALIKSVAADRVG